MHADNFFLYKRGKTFPLLRKCNSVQEQERMEIKTRKEREKKKISERKDKHEKESL